MFDDLRTYLQMASGVTEVTAAKAREVVSALLAQGLSLTTKAPDVVGQVQELADDLVATSKSNRDNLTSLIRAEVDRNVGRMGLVREDELAALRRHVQRLEEQIAAMGVGSGTSASGDQHAATQHAAGEPVAVVEPVPAEPVVPNPTEPVVVKKKKKVMVEPDAGSGE